MGRLRASIVCALALGAALGLAACGGSDAELLPGKTAAQINQNLDQVRAFAAEGDCAGAENAVAEVSEEVDNLGAVDQKLKSALRQGTERLGEVVSSCAEQALAEEEDDRQAEEEALAEQEEEAAVEAEEEELTQEEEQKDEKAQEKADKAAEKEQQKAEKEAEQEETETPGDEGPPAETPSGNEPPAGGVGPGTEVE